MTTDRIRSFLHVTPGRLAALLVGVCIAGLTWQQISAKAEREQRDREARHRVQMMDYEMGRRRDDIVRLFNASGPCRDRMAFFCAPDVQGGTWFWFRQTLKGRDVLDVEIPWGAEKGQKRVDVRLFMRDASGNLARVEPGLVPVAVATLSGLGVSQAGITACAAANEPKTIIDGRLKLICERRQRARFSGQNGDQVEGVQWHAEVTLP